MKNTSNPRLRGVFFRTTGLLTMLLPALLYLVSCQEPDEIGMDLIDQRASFGRIDTLTLQAFTSESGPIPTNLSAQNILGAINDSEMGFVKAGIFTEFRLPRNDFSLGENLSLDSVVLFFGYSGRYYGQLETPLNLKVFELSEQIPDSDTLMSNQFIPHYHEPIGQKLMRPAPTDSVTIDTLQFAPHFSIRLSDAFGQKLIDANGTPAFANVPNFREYFKGLYITVDDEMEGVGSIFGVNIFTGFTRLGLYFREGDSEETLRYDFYITEFAQRLGYFEHGGYEGANPVLLEQLMATQPKDEGDSLLFVRAMGQLRANIHIPYLAQMRHLPNVTINRANLIVPVAEGFSSDVFPAAARLALYRVTATGDIAPPTDMFFGDDLFGGIYDAEKRQYVFNVTRHIQERIDGRTGDYGMVLTVFGEAGNAQRVVLNGPGVAENPMRLSIIYTLF